jgi:hypothetical protein
MILTDYERSLVELIAVSFHEDKEYYDSLVQSCSNFNEIATGIINDGQKLRLKQEITKDAYRSGKFLLNDLLTKKAELEEKEKFLIEPKQEIELLLEKKPGIKHAKINGSRVLIIFDDGEELDVQFQEHYGLHSVLGDVSYVDPDGL